MFWFAVEVDLRFDLVTAITLGTSEEVVVLALAADPAAIWEAKVITGAMGVFFGLVDLVAAQLLLFLFLLSFFVLAPFLRSSMIHLLRPFPLLP